MKGYDCPSGRRISIAVKRRRRQQYAALPIVVDADGSVRVLLITSRETRRWVIPKGWAERGATAREQAAREGFEDAGLEGEIGAKRIGSYRYAKQRRGGSAIPVKVDVFVLRVARRHEDWPEKCQREAIWVTPEKAAGLVDEAGLAEILRSLVDQRPPPAARTEELLRPTA
jgi:ADP-ribose pyrophosphatase YjhB (NUDIX family)